MKHIIILVDQLYEYGGIEKLVSIKANYWVKFFNYQVTIISSEQLNKPRAFEFDPNIKFIDLGVNYVRNRSYFTIKNLKKLIFNVISLRRILNKIKPDFILVASHIPITYLIPLINGNAKTIKEFHFTKFFVKRTFKEFVFSFFENQYDYLVVLSEEEKSFYNSKKTIVIPNPLLPNKNDTLRKPNKEKNNKAIFIGRLVPVKNLEDMVLIWEKFLKKHSNWVLEIFGNCENKYATDLIKLVNSKGLSHSILFRGTTNIALNKVNEAKVMLLTSMQECFPMVILESLSVGVPVYSYNSPTGPRNILTDDYDGKIIELRNIENFASALSIFAENDHIQNNMSENALESSKNYFLDLIMIMWDDKIFKN